MLLPKNTNLAGLSQKEAAELQKKFGKNRLPEPKKNRAFKIFLSQFINPLVLVILAAAIISSALREFKDAVIILAVVIINAFLGFFQEYRAEKTHQALKSLLKPLAEVWRDGQRQEILAEDLVPGDLVILSAGDKVPADGEILESAVLAVNEAILTGESQLIFKDAIKDKQVFMGTAVASGRGLMRIQSIGLATELGKIALSLAKTVPMPTPLQIGLKKFGLSLTYLILILVFLIFVLCLFTGRPFWEALKLGVILAVAAIPEGLPIAVTVILVLGLQRVLKRKGLIKKLLAAETLGAVTTICTDKTGTLTEGNMRVTKTSFADQKKAHLALILCNNLEDNLEVAFWDYVRKQDGFDHQLDHHQAYPRLEEEPFSSENKYMITVNRIENQEMAFLKGAPEVVLEMCHSSAERKEEILKQSDEWAGEGLKILGLAYKENGRLKEKSGFIWLGLVGVEDPLRQGVAEAFALCRKAGVKVKIISGDHPKTVKKVAEQMGLDVSDRQIILGESLEKLTSAELAKQVKDLIIFARISPSQKMKIVEALQARAEVVAMVGDGVNDAPAIKKADIGLATGGASEVAKEAASLILLDNNFRTIVAAVEEGRTIFENIKKVVNYVLSNSFADMAVIAVALFLGWPAPVTVAQILWIHLICDGPVDIVLGFEPKESEAMRESPKKFKEKILDSQGKFIILVICLIITAFCLFYFWYFALRQGDLVLGRTMIFTTLAIISLVYIFSYRSFRHSFLRTSRLWENKNLLLAVAAGFITQLAAIYFPPLARFFNVAPLGWRHWVLALIPGLAVILFIELTKVLRQTYAQKGLAGRGA